MATTKRPFGMAGARSRGGSPQNQGLVRYKNVASSVQSAMYVNDPITRLAGGSLAPATATTDQIIGVARGFYYIDPQTRRPTWEKQVQAGTSSYDQNFYIDLQPTWDAAFVIQADATVSNGDISRYNFTLSGVGTGDTNIGISNAVLRVAGRTTASAPLRVRKILGYPDNADGDAFTIVEVVVVQDWGTRVSTA